MLIILVESESAGCALDSEVRNRSSFVSALYFKWDFRFSRCAFTSSLRHLNILSILMPPWKMERKSSRVNLSWVLLDIAYLIYTRNLASETSYNFISEIGIWSETKSEEISDHVFYIHSAAPVHVPQVEQLLGELHQVVPFRLFYCAFRPLSLPSPLLEFLGPEGGPCLTQGPVFLLIFSCCFFFLLVQLFEVYI